MIHTFDAKVFESVCNQLARDDGDLYNIINRYGYPPMWTRPNTFETLVHIILEQQVSLASALSALNKLKDSVQHITPARIRLLTDEEFRACYFSRQKTAYVRYLAEAILSCRLDLEKLPYLTDDEVRQQLTSLKGIGNWTTDIYLMFVLHRADIFPVGDLAAVLTLKRLKNLPTKSSKEQLMEATTPWQPYRTIATMILWHEYLSKPPRRGLL